MLIDRTVFRRTISSVMNSSGIDVFSFVKWLFYVAGVCSFMLLVYLLDEGTTLLILKAERRG